MLQAALLDQPAGQGRVLSVRHHPAHDVAAVDVLQDRAPLLRINFEVQHGLDLDIAFLGGAIA